MCPYTYKKKKGGHTCDPASNERKRNQRKKEEKEKQRKGKNLTD
jgi:hypothetical protein